MLRTEGNATLHRGWIGQYNRMCRAYERLWGVAPPSSEFIAGDVEDQFVHFFQDAYHLKDWLKNDPETANLVQSDIEQAITDSAMLSLIADLANGSKHLKLKSTRTGDKSTDAKNMNISGDPTKGLDVVLEVESRGTVHNAVDVAKRVLEAWDEYLAEKSLKP